MATFPDGIYNPTSPTSSNKLNDAGVIHADQHTNANLEITALQAKVGVDNSTVTTSLDYKVRNLPTNAVLTTPKVNIINTNTGAATAAALWGDVTSGSITQGSGLTSGSYNIASGTSFAGTVAIANSSTSSLHLVSVSIITNS